jgi:hypothetical protein
MHPAIRFSLLTLLFVIGPKALAAPETPAPPPNLLKLEREVSLRIAHFRDQNLPESDLKKLHGAQNLDSLAEQDVATGKYRQAESLLLRANLLLHQIGN